MRTLQSAVALALAIAGLAIGTCAAMWLTGTLGVSAVAAQAIVKAVEVGSWAMFLVAIATTGGLVGAAMWGALKLMARKLGTAGLVA